MCWKTFYMNHQKNYKISMASLIYLSLILIGLQVHCHHSSGHCNRRSNHGDKNITEFQHPLLEEEHGNKTIGYHKIAAGNTDFAFKFYKHIVSDGAAQNVLFSPLSISTAFAMLSLGARTETLHQIHKGFSFNLSVFEEEEIHEGFCHLIYMLNHPNKKLLVNVGNALFIKTSLKLLPTFLENVENLYSAEGFLTNFSDPVAAAEQINNYVQIKTHGKIANVVKSLDPLTLMVLVNYIYFKGSWKDPFDTIFTKENNFLVNGSTTVKVNFMYRRGYYQVHRDEDLSCWVVEVPYKGTAAALFILPDKGKLNEVEGALGKEVLSKWMTSLTLQGIHLHIPKFSIAASYDAKALLQRLGVTDVFNDNADLSGITGERNLMVSKAVHKAMLDVDESGTEAAAVTKMEFRLRSRRPDHSLTITFNRTFILLHVDRATQSVLFVAKVANPIE